MTNPTATSTATPPQIEGRLARGAAISPGVGLGRAFVLACADRTAVPRREISAAATESELDRFAAALKHSEQELLALKKTVGERIGASESDIFSAQAMVLGDPAFRSQVADLVRDKHINVEAAITDVIERFTRAFDQIPDSYLRERAADVRDVGRRLLSALIDQLAVGIDIPDGAVVFADELLPSVTARLDLDRVRGLVTDRGGKFSHSAILARSAGMPAVAGVSTAALGIKTGDPVIVDGVAGVVFARPTPQVIKEYERLEREIRAGKDKLRGLIDQPAVTLDGTPIGLYANVSKVADTEAALLYNADGIGLYRTEFSFSIRPAAPTEDEQFEMLDRAARRFHPRRLTLRLLDIGGDKELPYLPLPPTRNPSLAQRGIRLLLQHPEILRPQLRAFLRLSGEHPVSILVPVVAGVDEIRRTRAVIAEVKDELRAEGRRFDEAVPLGAMIEVPSAALMARTLAAEVDFFSLGTNDLVQYVLAADREDVGVAPYYQPLHPAVLRLIATVAEAADATERPLTICGDMASEPIYTELLLGLGLRGLSVAPGEMLDVKNRIRGTTLARARELARRALEAGSPADVAALLDAGAADAKA
jgi:phosphoenolpyruvate-protein phosphotransferase